MHHLTSRQYWGGSEDWKGYTACFHTLRDLQGIEHRFWADIDGFDAGANPPRPWDALAQKNVHDQAVKLQNHYRQFLNGPVPSAVAQLFPAVKSEVQGFEKWFTSSADFRWPTYRVALGPAKIMWNLDKDIPKPVITVIVQHNDVETKSESVAFDLDDSKRSGRIRFATDAAFDWSPFDTVELRVRVGDTDAVLDRYTSYNSVVGLLLKHDLASLNADPQLSDVEIACEFRAGEHLVPSRAFGSYLDQTRPRVIPIVPTELFPEILALKLWLLHHPVAYYRAAAIFEDLYLSEKAHPARDGRLARAVIANFRAFRFQHCADLAADLPKGMNSESLPRGTTTADLRALAAVAREAASLPRESNALRLLHRVCLLQQSEFRLDYLIDDPVQFRELDRTVARKWRNLLAERSLQARKDFTNCESSTIRNYLRESLDAIDRDLTVAAERLAK